MSQELILSLHTDQHVKDAVDIFGYAYGYNRISRHFNQFKYRGKTLKAAQNSPEAPIQIFYMEPEWYNQVTMTNFRAPDFKKFHDHQYKIYGTHLEATLVWPHWIDSMNAVDEIWVGNFFAKDAVINSGVTTPTYVFEHGIDDMWKPFKREVKDKIRFLHVDSDSPRKRADLVEKAFLHLFKNNNDVEITFKHHGNARGSEFHVNDLLDSKKDGNINRIYRTLSQSEMVDLYYSHDILVYPSEGEGFGFIPLQALATGMPTLSTGLWCSYKKYLGDNVIDSKLGKTQNTGYHYGEVVIPEYDSLIHLMKRAVEDFEQQSDFYFKQSTKVYAEYNWQKRCDEMLNSLIKRVGIDMLKPLEEYKTHPPVYIYYNGSGAYCTKDGVRFDSSNRIGSVSYNDVAYMVDNQLFRLASEDEIKKIDPYYTF